MRFLYDRNSNGVGILVLGRDKFPANSIRHKNSMVLLMAMGALFLYASL